jgi:hypothetical protein
MYCVSNAGQTGEQIGVAHPQEQKLVGAVSLILCQSLPCNFNRFMSFWPDNLVRCIDLGGTLAKSSCAIVEKNVAKFVSSPVLERTLFPKCIKNLAFLSKNRMKPSPLQDHARASISDLALDGRGASQYVMTHLRKAPLAMDQKQLREATIKLIIKAKFLS